MTNPAMLVHGKYYVDGKWVALKKEEIELFEWCKWISEETDGEYPAGTRF